MAFYLHFHVWKYSHCPRKISQCLPTPFLYHFLDTSHHFSLMSTYFSSQPHHQQYCLVFSRPKIAHLNPLPPRPIGINQKFTSNPTQNHQTTHIHHQQQDLQQWSDHNEKKKKERQRQRAVTKQQAHFDSPPHKTQPWNSLVVHHLHPRPKPMSHTRH